MTRLTSELDVNSESFKANAEAMEALVAALKDKTAKLPLQILVSSGCLYITFWLLHWTFGYGGGQLANQPLSEG